MNILKRKQVTVASALLVVGGGGVVLCSPPYYVNAPEEVVVAHALGGGELDISFVNLRNERVELKYGGDCCSIGKDWVVGPFESKTLRVRFDTSGYGTVILPKTVGLEMRNGARIEHLRIPFTLKVNRP